MPLAQRKMLLEGGGADSWLKRAVYLFQRVYHVVGISYHENLQLQGKTVSPRNISEFIKVKRAGWRKR